MYIAAWQTYVIVRDWRGQAVDAIGPYPLTCLAADSDLHLGIDDLRKTGVASVTVVVDGLLGPPVHQLQDVFTFSRPFKTHYLVDESAGAYKPSKHHRYELRRAARSGVEIRVVPLLEILNEWTALYSELIVNHRISGMQRFSRESFEALANCKGLSTVAGFIGGQLVSCHLWFQYKQFVWSHLAASNALGYVSRAAYAVCDQAIRNFRGYLINMGGTAGIGDSANDGLARFKAGFSNRTHAAYLMGRILDPITYQRLCVERGNIGPSDYFPAYRTPNAS
jgi:hypothetical protein